MFFFKDPNMSPKKIIERKLETGKDKFKKIPVDTVDYKITKK